MQRASLSSRLLAAIFAALFVIGAELWAQTGALRGVIRDETGAVLPGASVIITSDTTGRQLQVTSGDSGEFSAAALEPGSYTVRAELSGFKATVAKVRINVDQVTDLNLTLQVGEIAEVVEVVGESAPLVETTRSTIDNIVTGQQVKALPINGRNFLDLARLEPSVEIVSGDVFDPTKRKYRAVGIGSQIGSSTRIVVEGFDQNDEVVGSGVINISEEAIGEFQVNLFRYDASASRSSTGVINAVVKSGGNAVHGGASFLLRDEELQAGLPFAAPEARSPEFDREHYAFSIGGPFKRDKAFGFLAAEWINEDSVELISTGVLTPELSRKLNAIGVPTGGVSDGQVAPTTFDDFMLTAKVDLLASNKHALYSTFNVQDNESLEKGRSIPIGLPLLPSTFQLASNRTANILFGIKSTISPSLANDLRYSYTKFNNALDPVTESPIYFAFASFNAGENFRDPQGTLQIKNQVREDLVWTRGRHSFKAGVDWIYIRNYGFALLFKDPVIIFAGNPSLQAQPGFTRFGDVWLPPAVLFIVTEGNGSFNLGDPNLKNHRFDWYIQDDWKVTRNLTLNLGLRYSFDSGNVSFDNDSFVPRELKPILPWAGQRRITDKNNFAPRFGFAWDPFSQSKTAIRGGFGIFYDQPIHRYRIFENFFIREALNFAVVFPDPATFNPFDPLRGVSLRQFFDSAGRLLDIQERKFLNPYAMQFSIGVQHELLSGLAVQADYVHNQSVHEVMSPELNTAANGGVPLVRRFTLRGQPRNLDAVEVMGNGGRSRYDAFLLRVRYEPRRGFMAGSFLQAAYTASRLLNYVDDAFAQLGQPRDFDRGFIPNEQGFGPFDRTHRFVFSGHIELPFDFTLSTITEFAVGRPITLTQNIIDIDGDRGTNQTTGNVDRVPGTRRGAGNRDINAISDLNAFLDKQGLGRLKIVNPRARFGDSFINTDLRISRRFRIAAVSESFSIEPAINIFNLFNVLNEVGSGFAGLFNGFLPDTAGLSREAARRAQAGTLVGVNTAGGVLGAGGPRAFQLELRISF